MKPAKALYKLTEAGLATLGLADNIAVVLRQK
jgi:hypothetical protein